MYIKEIENHCEKGLIRFRIGVLASPCGYYTEPPGSISHGVCDNPTMKLGVPFSSDLCLGHETE
jgi:hypothetical protein